MTYNRRHKECLQILESCWNIVDIKYDSELDENKWKVICQDSDDRIQIRSTNHTRALRKAVKRTESIKYD